MMDSEKKSPITGPRLAFTWSPALKHQYTSPEFTMNHQVDYLRKLRNCCSDIKLYPEFHINGTMHWHGSLVLSDKVKWYKSVLPTLKYNGFVKIKTHDNEGWDKYICKDKDTMQEVLNIRLPITRDYFKKKKTKRVDTTYLDYGIEKSASENILKYFA